MQNAVMHRMKKERFQLITYQKFACKVLKTIGAFLEGKAPRDVRIQNRDDEDTFANLSCDEDLIDACRCLRPVDDSEDLYRLSVRVHATATPVQAVHVRTERTIVNEPAKRRCVSPAPRKFARNWDTRRLWLTCLLLFVFPVRTPAEETCILLFRLLCFVPGSKAVFAALVKYIVTLPARSRSPSQF